MKIMYVINSFNRAGAEKLVFGLSLGLRAAGNEISVVSLYDSGFDYEEDMLRELGGAGIAAYILHKRAGRDRMRTVLRLVRIIRAEKPELIHAHCSVPMLMAKLAGLITGVPVICTVHNTRGYPALRERLTSRMAKKYVSIGRAAERYMTDTLHIAESRIVRIYNAADTELYTPGERDTDLLSEAGLRCDVPTMLNVGRVAEQKNQLCFARAIKCCVDRGLDIQAVILGDYSETDPVYIRLRDYIGQNGMSGRIRLLGNRSNVAEYLRSADCFVMTSVYEGLSVAYLEAAMCNVPIITTELPFARELEDISAGSLIVPQNDHEAIADALCGGKYAKRSEAELEKLRGTFSFDVFVQKHAELYGAVIGGED